MADIAADLKSWSTTESSNAPTGTTAIGSGLDDNLRRIQATVRQDLANKGSDIASATTTDLGAIAGSMHDITGTTTITSFGTVSAGIWKYIKFEGALTLTHNATSLILPGAANITTADGDAAIVMSEGSGNWRCLSYVKATGKQIVADTKPSSQIFTSGAGTYTTPAGATHLRVRMVGGGGGGGAVSANSGSAGGNTTFSTYTASGGGGGTTAAGNGGAGGAAAGGTINIPGGGGQGGGANATGTTFLSGGQGGSSVFGGGGSGGNGNNGGAAGATNSGGGGGGAGGIGAGNSGAGGGAGGYVEAFINTPSASYSYSVGAAGGGGAAGGIAGSNGAVGIIIVEEFYD